MAGPAQFVSAHLGSHQVARVIYGSIVGLALVVALQEHPPKAGAVAGLLVSTGIAVALAEFYSDVVGTRVRLRHALSPRLRKEILADVAGVAAGAAFPAV